MPSTTNHGFLALEGVDGSGKTTTARLIAEHVRAQGRPLSRIGQHSWLDPQAARVIIDVREDRPHRHSHRRITEAYFRDKQLQARAIGDLLRDRTVLSDRYVFSDAAYLEVLYGIPARETLDRHHAHGTLLPDLIVYLDVPVELAADRVVSRGKSMRHYENSYTLDKVSTVYRALLLDDPPPYLPPVHVFRNTAGAHDDGRMHDLYRAVDDAVAGRRRALLETS
ncbi:MULTISPECIES: dTMP kinase [Streptomyces]|uniref:Thymidylate kinase n=1 Tax=Streptomyces heilongjiangensis TaxID=945052 RepID=A0ABW1B833_9ACTN|nr:MULTISPECIES: dTMP kinase [Streptomyces]MDC2950122.1 dTMP kinase [Streptomyces heilongjiangensis]